MLTALGNWFIEYNCHKLITRQTTWQLERGWLKNGVRVSELGAVTENWAICGVNQLDRSDWERCHSESEIRTDNMSFPHGQGGVRTEGENQPEVNDLNKEQLAFFTLVKVSQKSLMERTPTIPPSWETNWIRQRDSLIQSTSGVGYSDYDAQWVNEGSPKDRSSSE